ncbi:MAG: LysM peptidoglycan-binding domain-containing protein [Verrucomicrobia bacterium]|nr:LysM peptidoglycan-binding domain-containing protein [Verrucomicrobiota bacterium]
MKRLFGCFIFAFLLSAIPLMAQTAPEHVEKIDRMTRDIETLIAANADLQRRISTLSDELNRVRQAQARSANDTAVQAVREDLRQLAEKVQEVDRKRISDKDAIAKEVDRSFEKIEKLIKQGGGSSGSRTPTPSVPTTPIPSDGFEYVVKPGDTLLAIILAANGQLREQGLKPVTLQQVQAANPNLKPERMQVGQKVFIPAYK